MQLLEQNMWEYFQDVIAKYFLGRTRKKYIFIDHLTCGVSASNGPHLFESVCFLHMKTQVYCKTVCCILPHTVMFMFIKSLITSFFCTCFNLVLFCSSHTHIHPHTYTHRAYSPGVSKAAPSKYWVMTFYAICTMTLQTSFLECIHIVKQWKPY
jgi:hypothetical protein